MNINEAGIDITVDSETQQGKPYGVGVEIQTVTTRPGRKYGMRKALTPSPPPTPFFCFHPKTRPYYWLKMSHRNRTTFTLRYTVNVNEIFFAEKCDTQ